MLLVRIMGIKKMRGAIVCVIIVVGCIAFYKYVYDGTEYVKSSIDNKYYKVRSGPNKELNANLLALLNIKLTTIVKSLDDPKYSSNANVRRLIENWNKGITIKEIGKMESDAAYVINKQYMSFCLPEDTSKTIENINLMTYVGIHELAHVMSVETGHGNEFVNNFSFLLNYSKTLEYLDPVTNTLKPVYIALNKLNTADNYCGVPLINSIN